MCRKLFLLLPPQIISSNFGMSYVTIMKPSRKNSFLLFCLYLTERWFVVKTRASFSMTACSDLEVKWTVYSAKETVRFSSGKSNVRDPALVTSLPFKNAPSRSSFYSSRWRFRSDQTFVLPNHCLSQLPSPQITSQLTSQDLTTPWRNVTPHTPAVHSDNGSEVDLPWIGQI